MIQMERGVGLSSHSLILELQTSPVSLTPIMLFLFFFCLLASLSSGRAAHPLGRFIGTGLGFLLIIPTQHMPELITGASCSWDCEKQGLRFRQLGVFSGPPLHGYTLPVR